ncbi:hypothetical protein DFH06DRAFT_1333973 [Mycena polygramma]|nr:hypothetical protein DFH06DRAFT_1333973 [Mycena polygramma]
MSIICEQCGHRNGDAPSTALSGFLGSSSPPQLRAALEAVGQGILRQQMYLSGLEKQRGALELKLAQIVYPVLSLPPEITAHIFVECLPAHGRVRPSPMSPPLLLAQICRDWQEIALGTSELWRSLDIAFIRGGGDRADHLSLTIRSMPLEIPPHILPFIYSVAPQIHTLELNFYNNDFDILKQKQAAFPRLQRLAVVSPLAHDSLSIMEHVPSLTNLTIDSIALSLLPPSLTTLEIRHRIPFSSLLGLFRQCPKLVDLTVHVDRPSRLEDQPPPILPHLHSLAVVGLGRLDFLTLPALRRLILAYNRHLLALIQHWRYRESRLLEVLRALPSLTSLSVDVRYHMDSFTQVLEENPALLPQLTTLRISAKHSNFSHPAFIQLLRDRRAPFPGRIRLAFARLDLRSEYGLGADYWLPHSPTIEFDKLVAQGLELRLTCVDNSIPSGKTSRANYPKLP